VPGELPKVSVLGFWLDEEGSSALFRKMSI
jgi:hypothetical protein